MNTPVSVDPLAAAERYALLVEYYSALANAAADVCARQGITKQALGAAHGRGRMRAHKLLATQIEHLKAKRQ